MRSSTRNKRRAGVTLVEFLVAFGIFTILIAIASGSFVRSIRVQRAALQLMAVNDNMGITIEQMMREMRTGYHFCTQANPMEYAGITQDVRDQCSGLASGANSTEIQFVTANNETIRYRWIDGVIQKGIMRNEFFDPVAGEALCVDGVLDAANGICYRAITADNIRITSAYFDPQYNDDGDGHPPRVTLSFSVTADDPSVEALAAPMTIQTSVSARCGQISCPSDS